MNFEFRPVTHDDLPLLKRWMEQPHWQEWWGDAKTELSYVKDMLEGRDTTHPFLFCNDSEPVGYIQYWHVGDAQCPPWSDSDPWVMEFEPEAVGVDLSIGKAEDLSRGTGSQALRQFAGSLRSEGFQRIIIDPYAANARAVRAYEKAGFVPVEELKGKTGDVLLMEFAASQSGSTT